MKHVLIINSESNYIAPSDELYFTILNDKGEVCGHISLDDLNEQLDDVNLKVEEKQKNHR